MMKKTYYSVRKGNRCIVFNAETGNIAAFKSSAFDKEEREIYNKKVELSDSIKYLLQNNFFETEDAQLFYDKIEYQTKNKIMYCLLQEEKSFDEIQSEIQRATQEYSDILIAILDIKAMVSARYSKEIYKLLATYVGKVNVIISNSAVLVDDEWAWLRFAGELLLEYDGIEDIYSIHLNSSGWKVIVSISVKSDNLTERTRLISFENVSFSYVNSSNNAITDFSCVITPKQKTAIVGKNGAGKSTIVKLLLRLYDPKEGRICINGVDLREYSIKSLRNAIGIVMQNSKLYALTLRENVFLNGLDESMSDGELDELFSMVDLKIPQHGYDMLVTKEFEEDGLMFSGGEKQKISLIRSMVQYYPLIVLDEPTASLDPISEGKYIDAVYNSFNDSTVIMIAHRLSTIKNFNNILVLDNGRIVESGTHDELMKRHGMYYTMFMNQAKRYEDDGK